MEVDMMYLQKDGSQCLPQIKVTASGQSYRRHPTRRYDLHQIRADKHQSDRAPITLGKRTVNVDVKLVLLSPGMHVSATTKTGAGFGSTMSFLLTQIFYSGVI
jgi:hypothetical protein